MASYFVIRLPKMRLGPAERYRTLRAGNLVPRIVTRRVNLRLTLLYRDRLSGATSDLQGAITPEFLGV